MNEPWIEHPHIWKTKAAFFSWLRGGLRRAIWEKYPPKLEFKNQACSAPPEGYEGRARSGAYCALTGVWTGKSKLEVDHIEGEASLKDWSDVLPFVLHLCASQSNMQVVDKEAHKVKSYAERNNMTFQQALIEKQVITLCKKPAGEQHSWLLDHGVEPAKSAAARRNQIREVLSGSKQDIHNPT